MLALGCFPVGSCDSHAPRVCHRALGPFFLVCRVYIESYVCAFLTVCMLGIAGHSWKYNAELNDLFRVEGKTFTGRGEHLQRALLAARKEEEEIIGDSVEGLADSRDSRDARLCGRGNIKVSWASLPAGTAGGAHGPGRFDRSFFESSGSL